MRPEVRNKLQTTPYAGVARIIGPLDGDILGQAGVLHDRFMVSGKISGGGFALVEHLVPPKALAAPLHRHSREDEYSYVLEGRVGALLGDQELYAEPGDLVIKPRGQWHTFWNAGNVPLRILEIISPAGFEEAFREIDAYGDQMTPDLMTQIAARYGVEADYDGTGPLIERHRLLF
jgi:mannose-6-phosphate isomerase-like protein (cupin superfamily)